MTSEVKLLLPGDSWKHLRQAAGLTDGDRHEVHFLETRKRNLIDGGVILRTRAWSQGRDSTVKLRSATRRVPKALVVRFEGHPGFKIEEDCSDGSAVLAASLTLQLSSESPSTGVGLFSTDQLVFLSLAKAVVPWPDLRVLGPIRARCFRSARHDFDVTRWRIGTETLVEVSRRVTGDWREGLKALRRRLEEWDVPSEGLPSGKTRWALERL